jgi:hypothetical protein
MTDSLMYKTSFYDFGYVMTEQGKPQGYDRVRNKEIARKGYELEHLQEAFTRWAGTFVTCHLFVTCYMLHVMSLFTKMVLVV